MRILMFFAVLGAVLSQSIVSAQAPAVGERDGVGENLSGVYVAVYVGQPNTRTEPEVFPFTAEGRRAHAAYDRLASSPRRISDCGSETMPSILWTANPMEIVQEEERVLIRYEEDTTVRSIPFGAPPAGPEEPHSALGYSVARWEGAVLTIETTHMSSGLISYNGGHPISAQARVTERYWREAGRNDLRMQLIVDDPVNYTEPVTLSRIWGWSETEQLRPWSCVSLGPRDAEPDIDELARILEDL